MIDYDKLIPHVDQHPYPLMFATISGAHLYGFPSANSDFDLRGAHVLPLQDVLGLSRKHETIEKEGIYDGLEIDLVTHDLTKFFHLLLKKNGYVLEQVFSPLIVHSTPEHDELKSIATNCVTRHHSHHYLGFAATQWKLFSKDAQPRVKPLLYVFRVLLTGIHLMRTGRIEANLQVLNQSARLSYLDELIDLKTNGNEKETLPTSELADIAFYETEYERLVQELRMASEKSTLPEMPTAKSALSDLLVRSRLSDLAKNQGGPIRS